MIKKAKIFCDKNGARFTDPRKFVLEILIKSKKALTAYEVLENLSEYLDNPKPPTAYRAIEFWTDAGFIHRIESMNAYIVCGAGHNHTGSQFMICDDCGDVSEAHLCHVPEALLSRTKASNFNLNHWSIELHGQCSTCNKSA